MRNLSQELREAFEAAGRYITYRVIIDSEEIYYLDVNEIEVEEGINAADDFKFGGGVATRCKIVINNATQLYNKNYINKSVEVYVGIKDIDEVRLGMFTVEEQSEESNVITLNCMDDMIKLEKEYIPTIAFPTTLYNIYNDIVSQCNINAPELAQSSAAGQYVVNEIEEGITCRDIIKEIAEINGSYARFNSMNRLYFLLCKEADFKITKDNYISLKNEKVKTITKYLPQDVYFPTPEQTGLNIPIAQFECLFQGNPALVVGDIIEIEDKQGNMFKTIVSTQTYKIKGGLRSTISSNAVSDDFLKQIGNQQKINGRYKSELKMLANEITAKVSRGEMQSELSIMADGIKSYVGDNYVNNATGETFTTKTEMKQKSDSILASVNSSGGYNLVKNSRADNGISFWHGTLTTAGLSTYGKLSRGNYFRIDNDTTSMKTASCYAFEVKPNQAYTISFYVQQNEFLNGHTVVIRTLKDKNLIDTKVTTNDYKTDLIANKNVSGWTKKTFAFTTEEDVNAAYLIFYNRGTTTTGETARLYFTDVCVSEGVVKDSTGNVFSPPWSQHPSEAYGVNVLLDGQGLTVNNGAITIKNNAGDKVFSADTNGNLQMTGQFLQKHEGNNSVAIRNNAVIVYDYSNFLGTGNNAVGYFLSITNSKTSTKRCGAALLADQGDFIGIGYKTGDTENYTPFIVDGTTQMLYGQTKVGIQQNLGMYDSNIQFYSNCTPSTGAFNHIGDIYCSSSNNFCMAAKTLYLLGGGTVDSADKQNRLKVDAAGVAVYGTFTNNSDAIYKNNIVNISKNEDYKLTEALKNTDVYVYKKDNELEYGFITQEAIKTIPEAIHGTPTSTTIEEANNMSNEERQAKINIIHNTEGADDSGINLESITAMLWKVCQEQQEKLEEMEQRINYLEKNR